MGISFNCEHCGKKVEAPDSAAGKRAKCPGCQNKVTIPQPQVEVEDDMEFHLAPLDETEENARKQLMAETFQIEQDILSQREASAKETALTKTASQLSDTELTAKVIRYLRQMADGQLEEAKRNAKLIAAGGSRSAKILDEIAIAEMPDPDIDDIPAPLLSGLIRQLRSQIS
ncbi:MAG: zinc ribbon domain-containing protein [Planctomycetota bacterium]|jgi:DNA-directed RNA polymerase subunit RPC12/RpoP